MPIKPTQNRKDSAWLIHKHEKRHARLKTLADSINDSARMARGMLSLLLLVALYMGLTLVVSTDENLLVNGQVALPQTGVGISIVQSYIFAPPIFLYLHIQTLYLLSVLARKIQRYETALAREFPDATTQFGQKKIDTEREECWDWLSAFALVQLFRQNDGSLVPIMLSWLSTIVIPLLLLFTIDLSFVRYQSLEITLSHHIFLLLDLLFIELFRRRTLNPNLVAMPVLAVDMAKVAWAFGILFIIIVIFNALPPRFELSAVKRDQKQIWQSDKSEDTKLNKENLLDAGPCEWWGLACRHLDVRLKRLVKTRPEDVDYVDNLDLSGRNLRFAEFSSARLPYANFYMAKLQGADLSRAQLQGAVLFEAQLQDADLSRAQLQGADLSLAQLQGADLSLAQLQGADLFRAQLQGADLSLAQLQGADLSLAQLQGADLSIAQLQGADLEYAELQGADLEYAQLQGSFGKPDIPPEGPILMFETFFEWDYQITRSDYLDKLLTDLPAGIKLAWKKDATLKEHLQERIVLEPKSPNRKDWPDYSSLNYSEYSEIWSRWTSDFACQDVYGARSSLRRLQSFLVSYYSERTIKFGNESFPIYPTETVNEALVDARENREDCPGLRAIPDDEWERFYRQGASANF